MKPQTIYMYKCEVIHVDNILYRNNFEEGQEVIIEGKQYKVTGSVEMLKKTLYVHLEDWG